MQSFIGRNIKRLREEKNMTIQKLADRIGAKKSYIWKLENRTPKNPSTVRLTEIADVLGVSVGSLLQENSSIGELEEDHFAWEKYKKLDSETKSKVRQFIDMMM